MKILVVNAGSSSLKFQILDMTDESMLCKGVCEAIGDAGSFLTYYPHGEKMVIKHSMPNHQEALSLVLKTLVDKEIGVISSLDEIGAVGHRVLHGGEDFSCSVLVTDEVLELCHKNEPLGPLHMPSNILCMEILKSLLGKPQVAVFDTSFHQTMPDYAYRYAVPDEDYKELKVRRYGFHGTSHKYVSAIATELMGREDFRLITCHLGNGASVASILNGKVIDTSMGFTPLEGLVMGTRSGDIDPAIIEVIMKGRGISDVGEFINKYLNKKSGLKGIAGVSDMRELTALCDAGDYNAQLALNMFVYRIKKYIGAYASSLNGVDCIVMTGGIGENSDVVREKVLQNMEYLGVKIDFDANKTARGVVKEISTDDSTVKVFVIPTNEELVIARDTFALVK